MNAEARINTEQELNYQFLSYRDLLQKVNEHAYRYYVLDQPVVSDAEYDAMYRELVQMETEFPQFRTADSPTNRVGGPALKAFKPIKHSSPMLSIKNSMDDKEAREFNDRLAEQLGIKPEDVQYFAELKHDGLSCALRYKYGLLKTGATRGNGEVGEDVTEQVKTIKSIPLNIYQDPKYPGPDMLEIRGEIVMYRSDFNIVNEERSRAGEKPFINPRNAAAGSVRQLDPKVTAKRRLRFIAYSMHGVDGLALQSTRLDVLKKLGFATSMHGRIVKGYEGIKAFYEEIMAIRHEIPYDIDGIVFKLNDCSRYDEVGYTSNTPKWATAYKFPAEEKSTICENIDIQIGRTGAVTPMGRLKPVFVGGVVVSNATLHNEDHLARLGIAIGDTVMVRRAGDVVPEISAVLQSNGGPKYVIPSICPLCSSPIVREEGKADHYCTGGMKCPAQRLFTLTHFASKAAMDIDGFGEGVAQKLMDAELVNRPSDLYKLQKLQVASLEGMGEISAIKLVNNINATKGRELHRVIYALGIPGVGEVTAKDIARRFLSWASFAIATREELLSVRDVGPVIADNVLKFLSDPELQDEVSSIILQVQPKDFEVNADGPLVGKTFVLTGSFSLGKDAYKQRIEHLGGTVSGSVSKNTSYVLAGPGAGEKLTKAQSLGIPILDEESIKPMLA